MKTQLKFLIPLTIVISLAVSSCYYDNEEDLYPGSNTCDTTNVTYSNSVAPIFAGYCNTCHSGSNPSGNIATDNYASVKTNMSRIWGAINQKPGFSPMPKDGGTLTPCDLATINIWIAQGMPDN